MPEASVLSQETITERLNSQGRQIDSLGVQLNQQSTRLEGMITQQGNRVAEQFEKLNGLVTSQVNTQKAASSDWWKTMLGLSVAILIPALGFAGTYLRLNIAPIEQAITQLTTLQGAYAADVRTFKSEFMLDIKNIEKNYETREELKKDADAASTRIRIVEKAHDELVTTVKENAKDRRDNTATKEQLAASVADRQRAIDLVTATMLKVEQEAATRSAYNKERIDKLETRALQLETRLVPREEHDRKAAELQRQLDQQADATRRALDFVNTRFEQLYPASSFLRDTSERQAKLEAKVAELNATLASIVSRLPVPR